MRALKRLLANTLNFVTGHGGDARLREEMESHIPAQTEEFIGAGISADEARRQARLKLGGAKEIREPDHKLCMGTSAARGG